MLSPRFEVSTLFRYISLMPSEGSSKVRGFFRNIDSEKRSAGLWSCNRGFVKFFFMTSSLFSRVNLGMLLQ